MSAEGLRDDYGRDGKKQRENSKDIRKGFLTTTFSDSFPCDVYLSLGLGQNSGEHGSTMDPRQGIWWEST